MLLTITTSSPLYFTSAVTLLPVHPSAAATTVSCCSMLQSLYLLLWFPYGLLKYISWMICKHRDGHFWPWHQGPPQITSSMSHFSHRTANFNLAFFIPLLVHSTNTFSTQPHMETDSLMLCPLLDSILWHVCYNTGVKQPQPNISVGSLLTDWCVCFFFFFKKKWQPAKIFIVHKMRSKRVML